MRGSCDNIIDIVCAFCLVRVLILALPLRGRNVKGGLVMVTTGRDSYTCIKCKQNVEVESSWNVMAHGDAREGKWRGNWWMERVASTLHTTSEHAVSSITTADAHTSAASSRLNWRPRRLKWTRPFRRRTKSGFCTCTITFQTQSTSYYKHSIPPTCFGNSCGHP
jgi:DNA-directed RNA polymerase subunit RPC12/RpoP